MPKKDYPITTKAGKRQFIKDLSKNMERRLLDKIEHIPEHWDGIEIRAWMAWTWNNEYPFTNLNMRNHPERKRRFRSFKNDLLIHPL